VHSWPRPGTLLLCTDAVSPSAASSSGTVSGSVTHDRLAADRLAADRLAADRLAKIPSTYGPTIVAIAPGSFAWRRIWRRD